MKPSVNIWTIATLVLLFLFLWQWACKGKKCKECDSTTKTVYVTVRDTVRVKNPQPKTETARPIPEKVPVLVRVEVPGSFRVDTVWKPVDSAKILADYYTQRSYDESFPLDTLGVKGNVRVLTQVTENIIGQQDVIFDLTIAHKETVKIEKRTVLFLGLDALGSRENYGAGANLFLKNKKNKMFGAGIKKIEGLPMLYEAGIKMPISFK